MSNKNRFKEGNMTRVDLITGFLGSGKTTFIKEYASYLAKQGSRTAIIVNDYGAINVDRMLLGDTLSDSCHLEMVIGGDADCTRRRLKTKLITVAMAGYDHVIFEPSGIFDVEEFCDLLYEEPLERWYKMGSVITIMEDGIGDDLSGEAEYIFTSQIAKAGTVIVSKVGDAHESTAVEEAKIKTAMESAVEASIVDPSMAEATEIYIKRRNLEYINSCLEKYKCSRRFDDLFLWKKGEITPAVFEKIKNSSYHSDSLPRYIRSSDGSDNDKSSFESTFFFHPDVKEDEIEKTVRLIFDDPETGTVIRLKGFIKNNEGNWLEINATKKAINICPISIGQELFIVIGEGLNHEKIRYILKSDEKIIGTD